MSTPAAFGTTPEQRSDSSVLRFKAALDAFGDRLRVAIPGIIHSFDPVTQTVTVFPALTEKLRVNGQLTIATLPMLADVPIMLPRAGNFALTMPIKQGDECFVLFSDMALDSWYQSGAGDGSKEQPQNQIEKRRHDLSDGVALIGIWSQPNVLSAYSTTNAQLRSEDGTVVIDLADDQITVAAPTVTVNSTTANVQASGNATVQGDTVDITGSSSVTIGSNTTVDSRVFLNHTHSGVTAGGAYLRTCCVKMI